jgi:hypothetical protein
VFRNPFFNRFTTSADAAKPSLFSFVRGPVQGIAIAGLKRVAATPGKGAIRGGGLGIWRAQLPRRRLYLPILVGNFLGEQGVFLLLLQQVPPLLFVIIE